MLNSIAILDTLKKWLKKRLNHQDTKLDDIEEKLDYIIMLMENK